MSTMWAASPSELLMQAATRTAGRRRSVARRRMTLIAGLVMLGLAIAAVLLAPVLVSYSPTAIDPRPSTRCTRWPRRAPAGTCSVPTSSAGTCWPASCTAAGSTWPSRSARPA